MVETLSALLTPVIAIFVAYIGYQQWRTNQRKVDLDCYDRRLPIYKEVQTLIGVVIREGDAPFDAIFELRINSAEADFLFPPDICAYIEEVISHAVALSKASRQYNDAIDRGRSPDYDHDKVVATIHDECIRFSEQQSVALEKFKTSLGIWDDRTPLRVLIENKFLRRKKRS